MTPQEITVAPESDFSKLINCVRPMMAALMFAEAVVNRTPGNHGIMEAFDRAEAQRVVELIHAQFEAMGIGLPR